MSAQLYVGNLSRQATEEELQALFADIAPVLSVNIPTDPQTGQNKRFGFVKMQSEEAATIAIQTLHGQLFHHQHISVSRSRDQE